MQAKVFEAYTTLLQAGETITAEKIKSKLLGVAEKPKMILEIFEQHNEQIRALVGHTYAPLTYKRYQTTLECMSSKESGLVDREGFVCLS